MFGFFAEAQISSGSPTNFNYGIKLSNRVGQTTPDSIPVMDGKGIIKGYITKPQLSTQLTPSFSNVTGKPTTLAGYGITDAVPQTRTISGSNGILALGDLSLNRTLTLDFDYLDTRYAGGFKQHEAVRVTTTANITLSGTQTIDGVAVVAGNRVLVKNQTAGAENGVYVVAAGAWARSTDFDQVIAGEVEQGASFFVEEGTTLGKTGWSLSNAGTITLGTTALTFIQYAGANNYLAGAGLDLVGNTFSHEDTSTFAPTALTGANVISNLTLDTYGHATNWTTRALTTGDIGAQPLDGDLTSIAGLAGTSGLLRKTATDTWSLDSNSYLTTTGKAADSDLFDGLNSPDFVRSTGNVNETVTGTKTFTGTNIALATTTPLFVYNQTDGLVDEKYSYSVASGSTFDIRFYNDALTAFTLPLRITRSGTTATTIATIATNFNHTGALTATGNITGNSFIKSGGLSTQFLKADGSVDSNTYLTTTGTAANSQLFDNLDSPDFVRATGGINETVTGVKTFDNNVNIQSAVDVANTGVRSVVWNNISLASTDKRFFIIGGRTTTGVAGDWNSQLEFVTRNQGGALVTTMKLSGVEIATTATNFNHTGNFTATGNGTFGSNIFTINTTANTASSQLISNIVDGGANQNFYSSRLLTSFSTTDWWKLQRKEDGVNWTDKLVVSNGGNLRATGTVQGTQLISTIATGTAPLTVTSTTLVPNLNADMLDNLNAVDFVRAQGSVAQTVTGPKTFSDHITMEATSNVGNTDLREITFTNLAISLADKRSSIIRAKTDGGSAGDWSGKFEFLTRNVGGGFSTPLTITGTALTSPITTASTNKDTGAIVIEGGLGVEGAINAGGDITAFSTSDMRLKDNMKPITGAMYKLKHLNGYDFDWNEVRQPLYKGHDIGLMAQEVQKVIPSAVRQSTTGYLQVDYKKVTPLLVQALKEKDEEIQELKKELKQLKGFVGELKILYMELKEKVNEKN